MKIRLASEPPEKAKCDLLVVAVGRDGKDAHLRAVDRTTGGALLRHLRQRGFDRPGSRAVVHPLPATRAAGKHVCAVPVDRRDAAAWRQVADTALACARDLRAATLALPVDDDAAIEIVAEGFDLSAYAFQGLKSKPAEASPSPRAILLLHRSTAAARAALERGRVYARATCLARDLVNLPADIVTPRYLANEAKRIARTSRLRARVLDDAALRRYGMGALLGVARGSSQPPRFIELVYAPRRKRLTVALVGKGITFDSGGLSLKPQQSMQSQKRDMAGGANVLAVMSVLRALAPAVEVRGYVPATENMPGGRALKPGDVVRTFGGLTVEVLNTDAEGRLVLADGLSYAAKQQPDVIIDCATLTAAVRMALGNRYAAIMGTEPSLVRDLIAAGAACGENLWELPLIDEYRKDLDSSVADLKNVGEGRAGTIVAGLFLREFTAGIPWAHIDFSSTVVTESPFAGHPSGASGFGVRTLLRYLTRAAT